MLGSLPMVVVVSAVIQVERFIMAGIMRCTWLIIAIGALATFSDTETPRSGSARLVPIAGRHLPIVIRQRRNNSVTSSNWSGYAVTAGRGAVTDIKGSWIVPSVDCSSSNQ